MSSWWFLRAKPSDELTPDEGYDSYFSADGTEGTVAGDLYRKDANGNVVHVGGSSGGGGGTYTDEQAQDAVGRILFDTSTIDFTYNDPGNTITAVIPANAVTNTVLADMAGGTIKGRPVGSAGDPQDLNQSALRALLSLTSADVTDFTEAAQDAVGAALRDSSSVNLAYNDTAGTITGNVQAGGITTVMIVPNAVTPTQLAADSVTTVKIADGSVADGKLADMPAATIKGRATGAGAPQNLTAAQVLTLTGAATLIESVTVISTVSGSVTVPDVTAATIHRYRLNGNVTALILPSAAAGKSLVLEFKQDSVGSRTVTFPSSVKWPGDTAPTLTTYANRSDFFTLVCANGVQWAGAVAGLNYAFSS